jgi:hypothetical protein
METKTYELKHLMSGHTVLGVSVLRRSDGSVHVSAVDDVYPIYAFKMNKELMDILKDYKEVWYGDFRDS